MNMRKSKATHYVVDMVVESVSSCTFPADMLRYDSCTPFDEETARRMLDHTLSRQYDAGDRVRLRRFVQVGASPAPTFARWRSMGWRVLFHHEMEQHLNGNPMPQHYPDDYTRDDTPAQARSYSNHG